MIEQTLETVFAELGQRSTAPRKLMTEELARLAATGEGFTAEHFWHRLQQEHPTIGRATVFRAVRQLVERNVLDCIDFADGTRLYRVCGDRLSPGPDHHHHHLACNICHHISDFHFCLPHATLEQIGARENFRIQDHSLTIYGVCQNCQ